MNCVQGYIKQHTFLIPSLEERILQKIQEYLLLILLIVTVIVTIWTLIDNKLLQTLLSFIK